MALLYKVVKEHILEEVEFDWRPIGSESLSDVLREEFFTLRGQIVQRP